MIKWIVCTLLAHVLMPFVVGIFSIFLIEYWGEYFFSLSMMKMLDVRNVWAQIFWAIFVLGNIVLSFQWWFFRDMD